MSSHRYSGRHRVRNDFFSGVTPNFIHQDNIQSPAGEWRPAPWLPIVFQKTNRDVGSDPFVISAGKVVALDSQGKIVPAGLRVRLLGGLDNLTTQSLTATALTYTSTDYDEQIVDLTTGEAYATNGTTSYTVWEVCNALIQHGWVDPAVITAGVYPFSASGGSGGTAWADLLAVVQAFVSEPLGVIRYDVYAWAGRAEDNDQRFLNYIKQHAIQPLTELQARVPQRVASSTATDTFDSNDDVISTPSAGDFPIAGEIWTAADFVAADVIRYAIASGDSLVAFALANRPVAKHITDRTPVSCSVSGVLSSQKSSLSGIRSEGDWYLDAEVGLIFVHSDTLATLQAASPDTAAFTYYYYDDDSAEAAAEKWIFFTGEGRPGARLSCDEMSNFVIKSSATDIYGGDVDLGCVHFAIAHPRALMAETKSAFNVTGMTASGRMPGSATAGYPDAITLPAESETIADRLIVLGIRI